MMLVLLQGTLTPLVHAHAGRTPFAARATVGLTAPLVFSAGISLLSWQGVLPTARELKTVMLPYRSLSRNNKALVAS
jgi:hypothetical protein